MGTPTRNYYKDAVYKTGFYDQNEEPTLHVGGEVTIVDSAGTEITSLGGSTGGGNNSWSTASGQFTATPTIGSNTITLEGLPFSLDDEHVILGSIKKIDSSGNVTNLDTNPSTVSGDIITLPDIDNFVSGDTVSVTLIAGDKAYDFNQDANKVIVENPYENSYNSVEHIVDLSNASVNNYFAAINVEPYRNMAIQFDITDATGSYFKIYATLDDSASVPATGGSAGVTWHDITADVFGEVQSDDGTYGYLRDIAFIDTKFLPERYMIEYDVQNATNTVDVWIRKYN